MLDKSESFCIEGTLISERVEGYIVSVTSREVLVEMSKTRIRSLQNVLVTKHTGKTRTQVELHQVKKRFCVGTTSGHTSNWSLSPYEWFYNEKDHI